MRVRINLGKAMHLLPRVTAGVLLVCACSSAPTWARSVVLRNATVIDVTGAPSRGRVTVVIAGNRIAAIGDADTVEVPSEAEVLDATGIRPQFRTIQGTVDESGVPQGTLDGARMAYRLSQDRQTLTAEYVRKGSTTYGSLRRR